MNESFYLTNTDLKPERELANNNEMFLMRFRSLNEWTIKEFKAFFTSSLCDQGYVLGSSKALYQVFYAYYEYLHSNQVAESDLLTVQEGITNSIRLRKERFLLDELNQLNPFILDVIRKFTLKRTRKRQKNH